MRSHIYIFIVILILTISSFANGKTSQDSLTWIFPNPEKNEWKAFKSYKERLKVYNIPDSIRYDISIPNLVATCLEYPGFPLIFAYENMQIGYDKLKLRFNGFEELEKRDDAGKALLKRYLDEDPKRLAKEKDIEVRANMLLYMIRIETLLSQQNIISALTTSEKIELLNKCINIYEDKVSIPSVYSEFSISNTTSLMANVLELLKCEDTEYKMLDLSTKGGNYHTLLKRKNVHEKLYRISLKYRSNEN